METDAGREGAGGGEKSSDVWREAGGGGGVEW